MKARHPNRMRATVMFSLMIEKQINISHIMIVLSLFVC